MFQNYFFTLFLIKIYFEELHDSINFNPYVFEDYIIFSPQFIVK